MKYPTAPFVFLGSPLFDVVMIAVSVVRAN